MDQNNLTFRQFVIDLFKDERGSISIKPVVALLGAIFLCVTMCLNSLTPEKFKPSDKLVDAVMIITAVGMGADSIDKFTKKSPEDTPSQQS